ncbi:MAG: DNA-binding response regulator [Ignavibacteria bacterium]|nr:MAG: DNA-binding response regulator [Ignavibacteria bacterium]
MKSRNKILLAEDDISLGTILKDYLELKGYDVIWAKDGKSAVELFKEEAFQICILDIMMPVMDGFTAAKQIRKINGKIPFIFLTAKGQHEDIIQGLKLGADDYITKPFDTEELLLRIKNIIKRSGIANPGNEKIKIGKFEFLPSEREIHFDGNNKKLTTKESKLLLLLVENKGQLLSRNYALTKIWGDDNYFNSRSMDVYISKLRNLLKPDSSIKIITHHGEGYTLKIEE